MNSVHSRQSVRSYLAVFGLLLLLLVATVGVAYVPLGSANVISAMVIAAAKAGLVGWFFMHLRLSRPIVTLFALAGPFWLGILIMLMASDFLTR